MTATAERARAAALVRHARGTGPETTAAALRGFYARFEREAQAVASEPLTPAELAIRARRLMLAHLAKARAARRPQRTEAAS